MKYRLKNGKTVIIRKPAVDDAEEIINLISQADKETKFLARNPGEFSVTVEHEKDFIKSVLRDNDTEMFVAEFKGQIIADCSVGLVGKYERYRHRADVSFVVLKDYWGMGIGKILMQQCTNWCKDKGVIQIELNVVEDNARAINMYKSFGFKETGTIYNAMRYPDGTFANEKLMLLELL